MPQFHTTNQPRISHFSFINIIKFQSSAKNTIPSIAPPVPSHFNGETGHEPPSLTAPFPHPVLLTITSKKKTLQLGRECKLQRLQNICVSTRELCVPIYKTKVFHLAYERICLGGALTPKGEPTNGLWASPKPLPSVYMEIPNSVAQKILH